MLIKRFFVFCFEVILAVPSHHFYDSVRGRNNDQSPSIDLLQEKREPGYPLQCLNTFPCCDDLQSEPIQVRKHRRRITQFHTSTVFTK